MKIAINLVGVSFNDGTYGGRYRNYKDAVGSLFSHIVEPLKSEGHEISFYLFTYDNEENYDILKTYQPKKYFFAEMTLNQKGGGDRLSTGMKMISVAYIYSLEQLKNEDIDLVISTRFDIAFNFNPFSKYDFDFNKFNFFFREPEYTNIPIMCDTFYVFPHSMTQDFIRAITSMESAPPHGVNIGMHNLYVNMKEEVGIDRIKWVCDEFYSSLDNPIYKLTRHE